MRKQLRVLRDMLLELVLVLLELVLVLLELELVLQKVLWRLADLLLVLLWRRGHRNAHAFSNVLPFIRRPICAERHRVRLHFAPCQSRTCRGRPIVLGLIDFAHHGDSACPSSSVECCSF